MGDFTNPKYYAIGGLFWAIIMLIMWKFISNTVGVAPHAISILPVKILISVLMLPISVGMCILMGDE